MRIPSKTALAASCLLVFFCSITALKAQQLRTQYPEIALSDKRVLIHARVESFDGISFCITHDSGIEGAVPWQVMPSVWQTAFSRDPDRKARSLDSRRMSEKKVESTSLIPPLQQTAVADQISAQGGGKLHVVAAVPVESKSSLPSIPKSPGKSILTIVGILAIPYFFPTIVGCRKRNSGAIFVLNLFLGWTFVGWVVALVWAVTRDDAKVAAA